MLLASAGAGAGDVKGAAGSATDAAENVPPSDADPTAIPDEPDVPPRDVLPIRAAVGDVRAVVDVDVTVVVVVLELDTAVF